MRQRHNCAADGWSNCCICDGRIHLPGCTSRMDKRRDCCPERHKMLHDQGQIRGLYDDSQAMWSEEFQQGYHDPKGSKSVTPQTRIPEVSLRDAECGDNREG